VTAQAVERHRSAARHAFVPRGACLAALRSHDAEVLLSGPAGTGKSRAILEKVHLTCLVNPRTRCLIVRKTLASLSSTALVTWREHVVREALGAGLINFYGGSAEEPPQYRYPNGSRVMVGGMDKPTKIMSSEYDLIYVQEAIELTEADWDALSSRLRNGKLSYDQLIADTNPDTPTHWIKGRASRGDLRILESRHTDNPVLFDDAGRLTERGGAYMARLNRLTGVRRARLKDGAWVAAEGVIFEQFDAAVHLLDRFEIPAHWPRYWSVDFGFVHPFVLQCWAVDDDGRIYLYREIYMSHRRVDQHAEAILAEVTDEDGEWIEPRPTAVVCDHDAEGRATLEDRLGMSVLAADKRVTEGIQAVQRRLEPADDGRPRMFFLRDSVVERDQELVDALKPTSTIEEIPGYVWDTGGGKKPKEAPLKVEDDGCDAARYLTMELDQGFGGGFRWLS
jgi:PBSX family phage terminase large subunit